MTNKQIKSQNKYAFLFPVGIGIGVALGALIRNIGMGLAIGAGIGTACSLIGYYLGQQNED